MSLQVGLWCYATAADAAEAACAAVVPSSTVSGSSVVTLSCAGTDDSGALLMQTSVAPVDASASAVVSVSTQPVSYAPCRQGEVIDAVLLVAVALGVVLVPWWTYKRVAALLQWSRGEAS